MAVPLPAKCLIGLTLGALSGCTVTQDLDGIFCKSNCTNQTDPDAGTGPESDDEHELEGRLYVVAANIETDSPTNRITR